MISLNFKSNAYDGIYFFVFFKLMLTKTAFIWTKNCIIMN